MLALALAAGCLDQLDVEVVRRPYAPRVRPDLAALDEAQRSMGPERLRFGPYHAACDADHRCHEVWRPLTPDDEKAGLLAQSDCLWTGGAAGAPGRLVAVWEGVLATYSPDALATWTDPSDGVIDAGLCTFTDPETRAPWQAVSPEGSQEPPRMDCSSYSPVGEHALAIPGAVSTHGAGPVCAVPAQSYMTRLRAWTFGQGPLAGAASDHRCLAGATPVAVEELAKGVHGYTGASAKDGQGTSWVQDCVIGESLAPAVPVAFQLSPHTAPLAPDADFPLLEPVVMPVTGTPVRIVRALSPMPRVAPGLSAWSTPVSSDPMDVSRTRWEENFQSSVAVTWVELLRGGAADEPHLAMADEPAPALCIARPFGAVGCDFTCPDALAGDGRWTYDLSRPCTALDAGGRPLGQVTLRLTPTYDLTSTEAQVRPLAWKVTTSVRSPPQWIAFTLTSSRTDVAIRVVPGVANLGGAKVGEGRRAGLEVRNEGAQPVRITDVGLEPGGQRGDFVVTPLQGMVPAPLPIELVEDGKAPRLRTGSFAEAQRLFGFYEDRWHARFVFTRTTGTLQHLGVALRADHGLFLRDTLDARFETPTSSPGARLVAGVPTWAPLGPPFVLQPGERVTLSVLGTPSALGRRSATLRVAGESTIDPARKVKVLAPLELVGLQGPIMTVLPASVHFHADGGAVELRRNVVIENDGATPGAVGLPALTATGGGPLPAGSPFVLDPLGASAGPLGPGASQLVRVHFRSACPAAASAAREDSAELRWPTPDGPAVLPIGSLTLCP